MAGLFFHESDEQKEMRLDVCPVVIQLALALQTRLLEILNE